MRYLIAILLPPLAVLLCGNPLQAVLNLFLCLCCYFPGAIHAIMIVSNEKSDERTNRLIKALKGKSSNDKMLSSIENDQQGAFNPTKAVIVIVCITILGTIFLSIKSKGTATRTDSNPTVLSTPPKTEDQVSPKSKYIELKSVDGKSINAEILIISNKTIKFLKDDGQEYEITIERLTPETLVAIKHQKRQKDGIVSPQIVEVKMQFIPGISAVDLHGNLTKRGFALKKNIGSNQAEWTCFMKSPLGDFIGHASGQSATRITSVTGSALNLQSGDTNRMAVDFLCLIASLTYDGSSPEQAQTWVRSNVHHNAETVINGVKFQLTAKDNQRLLSISLP